MTGATNVRLGDNVTIEEGALLGSNVVIYNNVHIKCGAVIGDNVILGYYENECPGDICEIAENARIRSGTVIYYGCRIGAGSSIGHNCVIRERTIIGQKTYVGNLCAFEGDTTVGNNCGIHSQNHITKFCNIGDHTFIAPLFIGANDNAIAFHRPGHGTNMKGFTTGRGVRIAVGVTALPGVHFGEGCVVGAGSLVTADVPPYTVVMGRPARKARTGSLDPTTPLVED